MVRQRTGSGNSLLQWGEPAGVLERIAWGDQPPDAVKLEPFEREQTRGEVGMVRRIESSAEQADLHAGRVRRKNARGADGYLRFHGRI